VDPLDWPLICISWDQQYYTDIAVAFGIRHGASFTQRVSQAVCDILGAEQFITLSYIDDFIGGQASLELANTAYDRSRDLFLELGLDLNPKKCTSPTNIITWIGVTFNTLNMTMSIPAQVITDTLTLVQSWLTKTYATRHELQVLLGKLFYAGKCCHAARLFVSRMLVTLRASSPTSTTALPDSFRSDLHWWSSMLPVFNGRLLIQPQRPTHQIFIEVLPTEVIIHTSNHTTTAPLPDSVASNNSVSHGNCFAVLVALTLWGERWSEGELLVFCVHPQQLKFLVHGQARNEAILRVARHIWLITARFDIILNPDTLDSVPQQYRTLVGPPAIQFIPML
jgi:hypothetical protein